MRLSHLTTYHSTILAPAAVARSGDSPIMSVPSFSVGNTPLIKLSRISESLYGKAEFLNPTGSVKDRAGAQMLKKALESGALAPGKEILDSSSGNTGISLAAFGASLGFGVTIVLPESASIERQKLLRLYGANIVFSDPK
ncbi:MAG: pyridoxal-phosphate dependent enzyme [Thaumarchaeota archaeon]|nr:pyridoxal-phosphate dependent enzyme [Nitrososphaerota archaeon]